MTDAVFELVCGLEVHVELATKTKMFCRCSSRFGDPPNTNVCPVCLGLPGALPVPNMEAVKLAVRAALALNCEINLSSRFDRKNYFYPDLPKGYQISQYDEPLARNGYLEIGDPPKKIRIKRVHIEEDSGKSMHAGDEISTAQYTLVDFNRCGIPLIEIVTEPDIATPDEAKMYLEKLQRILAFARVSDVRMEEGSMRVDCNVSVRPKGAASWGVPCELKNLSSFRAVVRALAYEFKRQSDILQQGGKIVRETRHWDEDREITVPLRAKETSEDYRYFPDPDLPRLELTPDFVDSVKREMPPLPDTLFNRYTKEFGLSAYDAGVLTSNPHIASFFEKTVSLGAEPKAAANWIMGDLTSYMKARNIDPENIPISPEYLAAILELIKNGSISGKIAKDVLVKTIESGRHPAEIVRQEGLLQVSDDASLEAVIEQVIADNPGAVADFCSGKEKALTFLVGQVMKATRGKANPEKVNAILRKRLAR